LLEGHDKIARAEVRIARQHHFRGKSMPGMMNRPSASHEFRRILCEPSSSWPKGHAQGDGALSGCVAGICWAIMVSNAPSRLSFPVFLGSRIAQNTAT